MTPEIGSLVRVIIGETGVVRPTFTGRIGRIKTTGKHGSDDFFLVKFSENHWDWGWFTSDELEVAVLDMMVEE